MAKITYEDKQTINDLPIPNQQKVTADDMNEIKRVVNENADEMAKVTSPTNLYLDGVKQNELRFISEEKDNDKVIVEVYNQDGEKLYLKVDTDKVFYKGKSLNSEIDLKTLIDLMATLISNVSSFDIPPKKYLDKLEEYINLSN